MFITRIFVNTKKMYKFSSCPKSNAN